MDSLSQFILGAACGEAVLGKKMGNHAILWGGIAGTIPDLDVIFMPLLDNPAFKLGFHRGYSHSFLFLTLLAFLLAYLLHRWYNNMPRTKKLNTTFKDWLWLFLLALNTHAILDSFTTWGTQLFLPFSDARIALNNIFVADPIFTLPFTFLVLACLFVARQKPLRRKLIYSGLGFACLYICFTFFNKIQVSNAFKTALNQQGIQYNKFMTAPTPLNNILWYGVVETDDAIYQGLYSILDDDKNIEFERFEHNKHLIEPIKNEYAVDRVTWFAADYFIVRDTDKGLMIYDAKFGKKDFENKGGKVANRFIFPFLFHEKGNGELTFTQIEDVPEMDEVKSFFPQFLNRIKGNK